MKEKLHDLFRRDWDFRMETHPTWASYLGDERWNNRWGDPSPAGFEREYEHRKAVLAELRAVDRGRLDKEDQLNYDLFEQECVSALEDHETLWHLVPMDMRNGIQTSDTFADHLPFDKPNQFEDWLARLQSFGELMDRTIELMREGLRQGMAQPRVVMERVPRQVEKQVVSNPEDSNFFNPFRKPNGAVYRDRGREAIRTVVVPAYRRLGEFLRDEYMPACREGLACRDLPNGEQVYPALCRSYTTTNLSPDEIHAIGLDEVARIRAEMETTKERAGFQGSLDQFNETLRTDSRHYFQSGEEILTYTRALCKQIDPMLSKLFRRLPRIPYGVEPIPENIAPDTTAAYYEPPAADGSRAGCYRVNLYKPEARPKYEMTALTIHEAVPGHHLQIALATEMTDVPDFRRHGHWTSYVEGWALYSETLGEVMGLYDDPFAKYGQLTYEIWRAIRLVVDTGIHWLGWSRERAIDYFRANAAKTETDIVNEIDRYIGWPGQALAYKIGELKVKELRDRAVRRLGERYDVRDFHDVLLRNGPLPLCVLERLVDEWLG